MSWKRTLSAAQPTVFSAMIAPIVSADLAVVVRGRVDRRRDRGVDGEPARAAGIRRHAARADERVGGRLHLVGDDDAAAGRRLRGDDAVVGRRDRRVLDRLDGDVAGRGEAIPCTNASACARTSLRATRA